MGDAPPSKSGEAVYNCKNYNVDFIFLIAPTTTEERLKLISDNATGFVYLVALLGVTGARDELAGETVQKTKWALQYVDKPLGVGFGISKKEHVKAVIGAGASGVIVGSAFVSLVARRGSAACPGLIKLSVELKEGTR